MTFGFKDVVFGSLFPIYGAYKLSTTDLKEYRQFAEDSRKALFLDANGSFNPMKAGINMGVPIVGAYNLWTQTGQEKAPNPYGIHQHSVPSYYSLPPTRPAVGAH